MQVKMGIFLCDCGGSLKNIDFPGIGRNLENLEDVAFVDISHNLCLGEGKKAMTSRILTENINRVVIAACSPEFCEGDFTVLLEELRLNPNLLSLANIREQCSWAHEGDVSGKALELVMMAVDRARLLEPVETKEVAVKNEVLVVGGGFCGMKLSLELSQFGIRTTLMERESTLGGQIRELEGFYGPQREAMIKAVEKAENIEIITSAEVTGVEGKIGDFSVRIKKGKKKILRTFGAIVFATGYKTEVTAGDFPIKSGVDIISHQKLAQLLQGPTPEAKPETIGFIFDLFDENSRFPTLATLNSALAVKQRWGSEVYVFCKNVKVDSEGVEKLYREAREQGIVFLKFDEKPTISADDGRVKIEAKDVLLGEDVTLTCNLVVAEEKFLPSEGTESLSSLLKIRTDSQGFYQEENVNIYPVSSERKGIFFIGNCRGDLGLGRASTDVFSVVAKIREFLSPGLVAEIERVKVDPQKCVACLTCLRVCPHSAVQLIQVDSEKVAADIPQLACDRCGICAAVCPAKAIKFEGYSDEQILAQIEAIGAL